MVSAHRRQPVAPRAARLRYEERKVRWPAPERFRLIRLKATSRLLTPRAGIWTTGNRSANHLQTETTPRAPRQPSRRYLTDDGQARATPTRPLPHPRKQHKRRKPSPLPGVSRQRQVVLLPFSGSWISLSRRRPLPPTKPLAKTWWWQHLLKPVTTIQIPGGEVLWTASLYGSAQTALPMKTVRWYNQ